MTLRWGPGPVFQYEMLTSSRRWQLYAGRVLLVGGLLLGLGLVYVDLNRYRPGVLTLRDLAEIGKKFFDAIMWVELILTLLAVPAATAGAVCVDKMRGGLLLTMTTDLSDREIVLGKLASRLAAVLGTLACGLPVLAMTSWLGGVDPWDSLGGTLIIVGLAVLAVSVTLTFSVWATRPHEALVATYAIWAVWLLALPVWLWINPIGRPGMVEWFLGVTNPFMLLFANPVALSRWGPSFAIRVLNFAISLVVSMALAWLCIRRIRAVTVNQAGKVPRASRRKPRFSRFRAPWPGFSIDANPLAWREWHHGTAPGMGRKVWRLYLTLSWFFIVSTLLAAPRSEGTALGGGVIVAIGLLFVSATAATRLAEERAYGSLDVLLTTPLSSREIVEGKWWGAYRDAAVLAPMAGVLGLGMHLQSHRDRFESFVFAGLLVALVLAYGAVVTGVGVASAVRQSRLGRAIALSVTIYLVAAVFYPFGMILIFRAGPDNVVLLWPSPLFGVFMQLERAGGRFSHSSEYVLLRLIMLTGMTFLAARFLWRKTVKSFDRLLGRVPERGRPVPRRPSDSWSKNPKATPEPTIR